MWDHRMRVVDIEGIRFYIDFRLFDDGSIFRNIAAISVSRHDPYF